MHRRHLPFLLLATGALAACQEIPTESSTVLSRAPKPLGAVALTGSECGGQTELVDSRVSLAFASLSELASSSGITGDGTQPFLGGAKGVHAKVFYHDAICSRSGDVVFDPDKNNYRPARKLTVYFPAGNGLGLSTAGVKIGPFMNFAALMQLGSDVTWDLDSPVGRDAKIDAKYPGAIRSLEVPATSVERPGYPTSNVPTSRFRIDLGISGCETLEYERTQTSRTGGLGEFQQLIGQRSSFDNSPLGQWNAARNGTWTVQSADTGTPAGHAAQCYVTKKGSLVTNGAPMNVPFRVSVTELP